MEQILRITIFFDIYFSFVLSIMFFGFMKFLVDNGDDKNKIIVLLTVSWVLFLLPFLYIFKLVVKL